MTLSQFLFADQVFVQDEMMDETERPKSKTDFIDEALQEVTGFTVDDLRCKDRDPVKVQARQIGMYFYILSGSGLRPAGERFWRDHATANHSRIKIEQLYGQKCETKLTEMVNMMSEKTSIPISL